MGKFLSLYSSTHLLAFLPGPITDPVAIFLVMISLLLITPLAFERLRLPGIVGLILAGVVVGPHGLGILERDNTVVLLGTVGLLFLMFMAGLETSLDDLKYNADKAIAFGIATFVVPMALGTAAMMALGYSVLAAVLVASCFASHTLLALPILSKQGLMRHPAVTMTLGGTLITNILALLVLAIVVKAHQGNLTLSFWLFLIPSLVLYTLITLWGVPKLGRWFFRQFGHDEGAEFTFVVATLFVVSYAAKLIEIEPIIGAFLAGISITPLIPQLSPLMNRIQFIGNTLFVPFFLLSVGMLVNPGILVQEPRSLLVSAVMVVVAIVAKFFPAWGVGKWFKLRPPTILLVFGLSVAQAASTLAAITVAYNIELVDQLTVNGTIAMILVTCLISPWVTDRSGHQVKRLPGIEPTVSSSAPEASADTARPYRILVPVANPGTEDNLLHLALILAKTSGGTLLPLHILVNRNEPISATARMRQDELLSTAEAIAHAAVTDVEPIRRVDDSIDKGILRVAYERDANLIVCGWKGYSTYRENFLGDAIDNVVKRAQVPVLITRFAHPIETTRRVLLAITDSDGRNVALQQTISLANTIATELKANLEVLQLVSNPLGSSSVSLEGKLPTDVSVKTLSGRFVPQLLQLLRDDDLLILNAGTHANLPGTPVLGVVPQAIAQQNRKASIIIIHIPDLH